MHRYKMSTHGCMLNAYTCMHDHILLLINLYSMQIYAMFIKYMYNVFLKYVSQNNKESTVYSNVCLFQNYFPIRNKLILKIHGLHVLKSTN